MPGQTRVQNLRGRRAEVPLHRESSRTRRLSPDDSWENDRVTQPSPSRVLPYAAILRRSDRPVAKVHALVRLGLGQSCQGCHQSAAPSVMARHKDARDGRT